MMTFTEAIVIAKNRSSNFNKCQEYEDAFVFYVDDGEVWTGGAYRNCIIDKEDGRLLTWPQYYMDPNRNIIKVGEPINV